MRMSEEEMKEMTREIAEAEAKRPPLSDEGAAAHKAAGERIAASMCKNIKDSNPE